VPRAFYTWTRDFHLYFGLFASPFIVVFAVSVFFLNHALVPVPGSPSTTSTFRDLWVPEGIEKARGMEGVRLATQIMQQLGVSGEIYFIRAIPKEQRMLIPVVRPGGETTIDLNIKEKTATVTARRTTLWESLSYLHRSPGPHNVAIRGNWFWTRMWKWLADAAVYLTLFLSVSGVYLWVVIRSERKTGLILLLSGVISFAGIVYAVIA
jgi:hypothetical protein